MKIAPVFISTLMHVALSPRPVLVASRDDRDCLRGMVEILLNPGKFGKFYPQDD